LADELGAVVAADQLGWFASPLDDQLDAMDGGLVGRLCLSTHPRFDAVRMNAYLSRAMLLANVTYRFPMGRHLGLIGSRDR
jgi:hypothetical protein